MPILSPEPLLKPELFRNYPGVASIKMWRGCAGVIAGLVFDSFDFMSLSLSLISFSVNSLFPVSLIPTQAEAFLEAA